MAKKKFGLDSIRGASAAVNGTVTVDTQVNAKENTEPITNREIEDKMHRTSFLLFHLSYSVLLIYYQ